jgi:hypothetical protein
MHEGTLLNRLLPSEIVDSSNAAISFFKLLASFFTSGKQDHEQSKFSGHCVTTDSFYLKFFERLTSSPHLLNQEDEL